MQTAVGSKSASVCLTAPSLLRYKLVLIPSRQTRVMQSESVGANTAISRRLLSPARSL